MLATMALVTKPLRDRPSITSSPVEGIRQISGRAVLGEGRFVFVQFPSVKAGFGDDALTVHQRDVAHGNAHGDVVVRTSDG